MAGLSKKQMSITFLDVSFLTDYFSSYLKVESNAMWIVISIKVNVKVLRKFADKNFLEGVYSQKALKGKRVRVEEILPFHK